MCDLYRFCKPEQMEPLLDELVSVNAYPDLVKHQVLELQKTQYGNYVVQFLLAHGREKDRKLIRNLVIESLTSVACNKYASNIAEKVLDSITTAEMDRLLDHALYDIEKDRISLEPVLKDKFGNYIMQRLMTRAKDVGAEKEEKLYTELKKQLPLLTTLSYGKHVVYALRDCGWMSDAEMQGFESDMSPAMRKSGV